MANITTVTLSSGVPSAGTGTVSTLDNIIGTAGTGSAQVLTVQGSASGTAIPVSLASVPSHAVTNAGTFAVQNTAATPAGTNTIGSVKITDGTNTGTVKAASTAPVTATDSAIVTVLRPDSAGIIATGTAGSASATVLTVQGVASMTPLSVTPADPYATHKEVLAGQTAAVLGATGAIGDYLAYVTVYPGTAGCGVVTILDAASTVGTFAGGGTTALPSLVPFTIQVGAFCTGAGWKITTGTNVTVSAVGKFT